MEKSIDMVLSSNTNGFEDKIVKTIAVVDQNVIIKLNHLVDQSLKFDKTFKKISDKKDQAIRHAQRLMRRIIDSHGIKYDPQTQAVGVSKSDLIYIGDKDRIKENPDAEPLENDIVKAKVTKAERRKYNELIENFAWINERIKEHNVNVESNETQLINFEKTVLSNEEYDKEKQHLLILLNGKVMLCNK